MDSRSVPPRLDQVSREPRGSRSFAAGFASGVVFVLLLGAAYFIVHGPRNSPESLVHASKAADPDPSASLFSKPVTLTQADLVFGNQQLERMASDRPLLLRDVRRGDPIWEYCAKLFGGQSIGERVYWDSGLPPDTTRAEHQGPYRGEPGWVRVRETYANGYARGRSLSCEDLWSALTYELESMKSTPGFTKLYLDACAGRLTREQFVRGNSMLEYRACLRTATDYPVYWKPTMESRGVLTSPRNWKVGTPDTYEKWIARFTDPNGYPWNSFGVYYDTEITPYLARVSLRGR